MTCPKSLKSTKTLMLAEIMFLICEFFIILTAGATSVVYLFAEQLGERLSGSLFRGIIEVWFCHNEGIRRWIPAEVITHRQGRVKRNRKTLLTTLCEGDILNLIKLRKKNI